MEGTEGEEREGKVSYKNSPPPQTDPMDPLLIVKSVALKSIIFH